MLDLKKRICRDNNLRNSLRNILNNINNNFSNHFSNKQGHNWRNAPSYFSYTVSYAVVVVLLSLIASEAMAVDLGKFGKGVTDPLVKFANDYWIYAAGIGGIATALLSEGDGRVRIIRGGTVFVGASAICMGILAAMAP
jgi:hypothetical protein